MRSKKAATNVREALLPYVAKKKLAKSVSRPTKVLQVDGITVLFTKKRVKNINMRLASGGIGIDADTDVPGGNADHLGKGSDQLGGDTDRPVVKLSSPYWTTEAQIKDFVRSKRSWIERQQDRQTNTLKTIVKQQSSEELAEHKLLVACTVPPLVAKWEQIIGVKAQKIAYRSMTSRWGSCNSKTGRICINIQLACYPEECLEYVVVHELCHLLERGHGSGFYALLDRHLPDWKQCRVKLKA